MSDPRIEAAAKAMANKQPHESWEGVFDAAREAMLDRASVALKAADEADERAGIQRVRLTVLAERLVNVIRDGAAIQ